MADNNNSLRDDDKRDAQDFASLLKDARSEPPFLACLRLATGGYIQGVLDACFFLKSAKQAN